MSTTMREMLEAGVHFGHQTRFWNPKMAPFIFGHRNKIHIVNLEKSLPMFQEATKFVRQLAANRGTVLMVGTKRQAREIVAAEAQRAGVPYVDQRWLGGMLTNFKTVKTSIKRLKDMKAQQEAGLESMSKKEQLMFSRELEKLEKDIKQKLAENKKFEQIKDQVSITRDKEGLRIEIIDKADFAMFPSGGVGMQGKAASLISEVAASLADMPNKVAIRGHTDAVPFQNPEGRNNWSLSAERAEVTRQLLQKKGIKEERFTRIEGVADTDPFNPKDKFDPRNRRMSITVLNQDPS